jgi:hypothetical protein
MPVLADNEMVVHRDTEGACDLHNRLRHLDVGARGGRIARGMVVQHAQRLTKQLIGCPNCHVGNKLVPVIGVGSV